MPKVVKTYEKGRVTHQRRGKTRKLCRLCLQPEDRPNPKCAVHRTKPAA